jgi:hypothetical protein
MDLFLIKALNSKLENTTFALRFESKANEERVRGGWRVRKAA